MKEEYTYKYEITLDNKEDVETLFNVVEKFTEGSSGSIKPLDKQSFEITTEIFDITAEGYFMGVDEAKPGEDVTVIDGKVQ